jgi:hypothetical protein
MDKGEIILYQSDDRSTQLEVRMDEETVWLTQAQMVELFSSSKQNISLHITNIFNEGELKPASTVKEYLTVQMEGVRKVKRKITVYNLDVIISVGYRVKSHRGTQFRIWANRVLKDFLLKGHVINYLFYDGQIFDAYRFASDLIKSAKDSSVLIDNYVDESVLTLLSKRSGKVSATIYTASVSKQLGLDLKRFNAQYPAIGVKTFTKSHDRFLIIDQEEVYHLGASLKDLGKKWFAFSKIELDAVEMIGKLSERNRPVERCRARS